MKPELIEVTVKQTLTLADADGMAIHEGSVLRHITGNCRGVVDRISRLGMCASSPFDQIGDIHIRTGPGSHRCTNNYKTWRHIPKSEQTHEERFLSWINSGFDFDGEFSQNSRDAAFAISGIQALLPPELVDHMIEECTDSIETALGFLADYLDELQSKS